MIDDSFNTRIKATLTQATAMATRITSSIPRISLPHPLSGVSTNDATTRHNVVSAPTPPDEGGVFTDDDGNVLTDDDGNPMGPDA